MLTQNQKTCQERKNMIKYKKINLINKGCARNTSKITCLTCVAGEGEIVPIIKAAKKAMRSSQRKQIENLAQRIKLKKAIKNTNSKNLAEVLSLIDKATKNGLIHKNKAARIKSRLSKIETTKPKKIEQKPRKKIKK